jgi:hypothetical protein
VTYGAAHRNNAEKRENQKPILLVLLAVLFAPLARADTITTTGTVSVQVGCWNPAVCGDPAAYWNGIGLNVPAVEPPADDFSADGTLLFDWAHDPPTWFVDTPLCRRDPVSTPEPGSLTLLAWLAATRVVVAKVSECRMVYSLENRQK